MEHKITKFIILLLAHILFMILVYGIAVQLLYAHYPVKELSYFFTFVFHSFFNLIYFFWLWKDLYSFDYHFLLKKTSKLLILKNLILSLLSTLFMVLFINGFSLYVSQEQVLKDYFTEILIIIGVDVVSLALFHGLQMVWTYSLVYQGYLTKNVLVVGEPDRRFPLSSFFAEIIKTNMYQGRLFLKEGQWYFTHNGKLNEPLAYTDIPALILNRQIGELIIFIGQELPAGHIYEIVNFCREYSIGYYLVPDIKKLPPQNFWSHPFTYIPLIERFSSNRDSLTFMTIKRLFDLVLILFSLPVLLPLCLLVALLIKLEDGGPVLYISQRVGKNGKLIKFYKFRSMVPNAEALKQDLLKYNERRDGPLFKMRKDPRVTKVGKLIRSLSLDEVPQLLNVLKGEMSLVGPRPHLVNEVQAYTDKDILRLECFPGLTCYPQIHGRNTMPFKELVDLDLLYRKRWSLAVDIKIIMYTLKIIIWPLCGKDVRIKKPY